MSETTVIEKDVGDKWDIVRGLLDSADDELAVEIGLFEDELDYQKIIAAVTNEFGHAPSNIPARPAHRTAFDDKVGEYVDQINEVFRDIDHAFDLHKTIKEIGFKHKAYLKSTIQQWNDPPNKPLTVAKKGFNDPLIETRETVRSVEYRMVDE